MRCASCQTVNPADHRFCGQCGTALLRAQALPQWGELKQATVLFADIVGSTEQIAGLDPEQAMSRLRPAILRMCESVERFGGTVVRTLGDGVMALFGVPKALEGHALLACEAALHMQSVFQTDPHGLAIRIGLHSGAVASDPNEADSGRGGGAHGLTIHLASRVVGLAPAGGICLTEACRALAGGGCVVQPLGAQALRGISEQVEVHALTGLAASVGLDEQAGVPLTPFRGRAAELAHLLTRLDGVVAGGGRAIGICAEPGAGKSRLCHELARVCEARGMPVMAVRAQLYGHAMPLQPVLELLRHHFFGIRPRDAAAVARQRIAAGLARTAASTADLTLMHEFLGVAAPEVAPLSLGPKARQARLLALLTQLFRLDAEVPRLVLVEDLHWLDDASEAFVAAMVEAVAGTRTLLVLNYRTAYQPPWASAAHFEQVDLRELGALDMTHLVRELLAPVCSRDDVCQLVVERSGGNPFFAEELVRTLMERALLAPGNQLPQGGMEAVARALPDTVQAVIGARLDRLGEPEKTLLQMCAIIGKEIPLAVLEDVASPLAKVLQEGMRGLCSAGLILPHLIDGARQFVFRHPLIQEVAYNSQLKVRRGQLHSLVASAMEAYYIENADEHAALISYHFESAGGLEAAASYGAKAARWVGTTASALAINHWRRVWTLLDFEQRAPESNTLRALAGAQIAWLGWREGLTLDDAKPYLGEAFSLVGVDDAPLKQLLLLVEGRMVQSSGGAADRYVERISAALALSSAAVSLGRVALLKAALSQAYGWSGRLVEALEANTEALDGVALIGKADVEFIGFDVEHWVLAMRSRLLTRMGRFDLASECLLRLQKVGETSTDPVIQQMPHYAGIELAWYQSDLDMARRHAAFVVDASARGGNPYLQVFSLSGQAMVTALEGDFANAVSQFSEALALVRSAKVAMEFEAEILSYMAWCSFKSGMLDEVLETAKEAVELARRRSNRVSECRALIALGAALAERVPPAMRGDYKACFADARRLVQQTGAEVYGNELTRAESRADCGDREHSASESSINVE